MNRRRVMLLAGVGTASLWPMNLLAKRGVKIPISLEGEIALGSTHLLASALGPNIALFKIPISDVLANPTVGCPSGFAPPYGPTAARA